MSAHTGNSSPAPSCARISSPLLPPILRQHRPSAAAGHEGHVLQLSPPPPPPPPSCARISPPPFRWKGVIGCSLSPLGDTRRRLERGYRLFSLTAGEYQAPDLLQDLVSFSFFLICLIRWAKFVRSRSVLSDWESNRPIPC
ncbi:hypothetical protein BS78_01G177300 [Paspalum vaginatum]|nr:hypothetical protein BS78_01G177300 [Paspalum vaginatum]